MEFSEQQIQIIDLLRSYKPLTLNQISVQLELNKSSVLFGLQKLLEENIIEKVELSPKKIIYKLKERQELERYIEKKSSVLESLLINKGIEGIDAYKNLLRTVAYGKGDIWGYANLERKIIPELMDTIEWYRDFITSKNRIDYFSITNTPENIALLKDHSRKPEWKPHFVGRVVEKDILDVNCDIYVWDGNVGICNFENNKFKVIYYEDHVTYELFLGLLKILFEQGQEVTH